MSIPEILEQKYSPFLVSGYREGWFDPTNSKCFAYSIVNAKDEDFSFEITSISGYGYVTPQSTDEDFCMNNADGTFCYKELRQLIEESIFTWCCIAFYGRLFKGDWYLGRHLTFYNDQSIETATDRIQKEFSRGEFWNDGYFSLIPPYYSEIDIHDIARIISNESGELVHPIKDFSKVSEYMKNAPRGTLPERDVPQHMRYREFIGLAQVVAQEKAEQKEKINEAFENYMNEEIFLPFARALHKNRPEEFHQIDILRYGGHFRLIYPHSKRFVICVMVVTSEERSSTLHYFLYMMEERNLFQWTFLEPRVVIDYMGFAVIEDIKRLSSWNDANDLTDPNITMDDENFWNEYVFKKSGDRYLYLKPVGIQNSQKAIFTQW